MRHAEGRIQERENQRLLLEAVKARKMKPNNAAITDCTPAALIQTAAGSSRHISCRMHIKTSGVQFGDLHRTRMAYHSGVQVRGTAPVVTKICEAQQCCMVDMASNQLTYIR